MTRTRKIWIFAASLLALCCISMRRADLRGAARKFQQDNTRVTLTLRSTTDSHGHLLAGTS